MRKYWVHYCQSISQTLAYRGSLLLWLIGNLLSIMTGIAVWLSASNNGVLGGYTLSRLITYSIVGIFIGWAINWNPFPGIKEQIKKGDIAALLIKPISFVGSSFTWEAGWRTVCMAVGLIGTLLASIVLSKYLSFPPMSKIILLLPLALILGTLIQFSFGVCLGLLAFWFTEIEAIASLRWIGLEILGGAAIPISFIPQIFQPLIKILPFRHMYSFPMEILFGKVTSGNDLLLGFLMQIFWLITFFIIYKIMWQRGLKVYVSVGQ